MRHCDYLIFFERRTRQHHQHHWPVTSRARAVYAAVNSERFAVFNSNGKSLRTRWPGDIF